MKFCTHCGNPLDPGNNFCTACGTPVEKEVQTESPAVDDNIPKTEALQDDSVANSAAQPAADASGVATAVEASDAEYNDNNRSINDVQTADDFTIIDASFDSVDAEKGSKTGKLKKRIIAAAVVVCVLFAAVAAAYSFYPPFKNWCVKTFASPSNYLGYVLEENLSGVDSMADFIDSTYDMSIKLSVDDTVANALSLMNVNKEVIDAIKKFKSAEISSSMTFKETQFGISATGSINDQEIATANISADFKEKMAFFDLVGFNENAFGVELDDETVTQYLNMAKMSDKNDKKSDDTKKLITKYVKIILSDLNVKKGSDKLEAGNLSEKYTTLYFTVQGSDLKKILQDILDEAKDDDRLLDLLLEAYESQTGMKFDKSELKSYLKQMHLMVKSTNDGGFGNFKINFVVFVDGSSKIRGIDVEESSQGMKILYFADVEDGKEFETEFNLANMMEIYGSGTVNGKKRTGEYEFAVINPFTNKTENMLIIALEDWASDPMDGRLSIRFAENFLEDLLRNIPLYERASKFERDSLLQVIKNIEIFVDIEEAKKDRFAGSVGFEFKDIDVLKLEVKSTRRDAEKVSFPDTYTDDAEYWAEGIDTDIMKRLEKAFK